MANTRPTLMPWARAASWSKATARMAMPGPGAEEQGDGDEGNDDGHHDLDDLTTSRSSTHPRSMTVGAPRGADRAAVVADHSRRCHGPQHGLEPEGDHGDGEQRLADHRPDEQPLDDEAEQRGEGEGEQRRGEPRAHSGVDAELTTGKSPVDWQQARTSRLRAVGERPGRS